MSTEQQQKPSQEDQEKAENIYAAAVEAIKRQDFETAEKHLRESLKLSPSAKAYHNLATIEYIRGNRHEAVQLFQSAVDTDHNYDEAYINLMRIFYEEGEIIKAIEYAALALTAAPDKRAHKEEFIKLLTTLRFELFNPDLKQLITFCLEDENLDFRGAEPAWLSILEIDPDFAPIYDLRICKSFTEFEEQFLKLSDYKGVASRYFTLGLTRMKIEDQETLTFLSYLRRLLLQDHVKENNVLFGKNFETLAPAIAAQRAKQDETALQLSEEEQALLTTLKSDEQDDLSKTVLSCYEPEN